jgi:hypothetical protein
VRVERRAERAGEGPGLGRVIPVIVGYEEPQGRLRHNELGLEGSHALGSAGRPDTRVHEHTLAFGFDHQPIPARAGAEDEHLHEGPSWPSPLPLSKESGADWRLAPRIVL